MSRSNNPQPQFAARPLPGHLAADQDAQAWNAAQGRAPHQGQQAPQGYAQPYAYQPEVPPGPYAQQPAPPDPFAGTPYAAQQGAPQARQAPAYAPPQHDPYAAAQAAQPQAYGAAPAYGGHPQWPAGAQDQGGYDINGYPVGGGPSLGTGYDMGRQAQQHRGGAGQWAGADPYGAEPSFEPALYGAPQQHGGTVEQTYAEEDAAYEMEPPPGRSRKLAMVLLGAVIVGGGLTYAYSALLGPSSDGGATPVVKGAEGPFKVKPSDPGGKQFAHTDSKIMGRLGDGGQAAPSSDADTSGARKVPVLTVGRDGSIQAPEEPSPQRATVTVPGMLVSGGLGGPPPSPPARAETAEARPTSDTTPEPTAARLTTASAEPQQPVVVSPPAAPKKSEEPASSAGPQSLSAAADAAAPSAEPKKAAPAPKKTAAVTPPAAPVAATPAPTGAGWVAVLLSVPASGKSRMDALKQFADMQQKYGPLLQNKTPDIQEANLGEKGTYHRLMVGPPGSREMASELCTQLKAQGYPSCWVTAY
jgi:hypothetical protein